METGRKKIIFTVTNDLNYDQRMIRICTSLHEAGYDVELTGRLLKHSLPLRQRTYKQTRLRCFFNKGKFFYLEYNLRLFIFLVFSKADVFSAVDLDTLSANTLAAKIRSKKLIFDAHEYFTEVPEVMDRKLTKSIWSMVAKLFIPHTDLAYTVNQSLAGIFGDLYHRQFEVIRSVPFKSKPSEKNLPASQQNKTEKIILYQGALNEGRGIEQCILAMKEVDAICWIAGEGDLSSQLREMVVTHHLSDKVKFIGYILPEKLKEITDQAYIGFNVFDNKGLSYYYSLNNKFFDYIQSGIPQICTAYPEFDRVNSSYHIGLVCACDPAEIAGALNQLLNNKTLYETLAENCVIAADLFNWEQEEKELIRIYKNVIR